MIDNKTPRLNLPLPDVDNYLESDVARLGEALSILDRAATVDASGKIHVEQLPAIAITDTFPVDSQEAMLSLNAQPGDVAIRSDVSNSFILMQAPASVLQNWKELLNNSLKQVTDYAALRLYNGGANAIYVTGIAGVALPSGIAGHFVLDAGDTTTADDGATCIVGVGGVRWKRAGFHKTARLSWWELQANYDATLALPKMARCGATELIIDLDVIVTSHTDLTDSPVKKIITLGGCGIRRIGNGSIFVKHGMLVGSPVILTGETLAPLDASLRITGNDTSSINIDDWIFINSDCLSPNVTSGSKTGMLRRVIGKSSNFLTLDMSLSQEVKSTGTTKGKVYRVQFGKKVVFEGGRYTSDSTTSNKVPLLHFLLCYTPDLNGVVLTEHGGQGAVFVHCLGGEFNNSETSFLTDNQPNGNFGYGIALGGATRDYAWNTGLAERCRHGITTGTAVLHTQTPQNSWMPWAEPWFPDLNLYGVPESVYLGPVACRDCTNAGIDTHENAVNILIRPNVNGGFDGINIRSWGVNVDGGQVIGTRRSNIRIFGAATNPVAAGWTGEIKIKGTLLKGMSLSGATEGGAIYSDQPGGSIYLENVTIEESSAEAINILGAGTVLNGNNITIIKSSLRGTAPAIRNAGSNGKIVGLTIKNFATGIIDTGTGNEYVDVAPTGVDTVSTGNGRLTTTDRSGRRGDAIPGRFLIGGGRVSANALPAADNLMYVVPVSVPNVCKVANFVINAIVASSTDCVTRFALYADTGRGFPGAYACGGGVLLTGTTVGINKSAPTNGNLTLQPGIYWIAIVQQGGVKSTLAYSDEAIAGVFSVGMTTDIAALSGVAAYTKTHVGGISTANFTGPINESTLAPKIAIELQ